MRQGPDGLDATPRRPRDETDPYRVLGVPRTSTSGDIKTAYRKLAMEFHPDMPTGSEDDFKALNNAYALLGDADSRTAYDRGLIDIKGSRNKQASHRRHPTEHSAEQNELAEKLRRDISRTASLDDFEALVNTVDKARIDTRAKYDLRGMISECFIQIATPLIRNAKNLDDFLPIREQFNRTRPNGHYLYRIGVEIGEQFLALALPLIQRTKNLDDFAPIREKFMATHPNQHYIYRLGQMISEKFITLAGPLVATAMSRDELTRISDTFRRTQPTGYNMGILSRMIEARSRAL